MTDQCTIVPLLCILAFAVVRQSFVHKLVSEDTALECPWAWLKHHRNLMSRVRLQRDRHMKHGNPLNILLRTPLVYLFRGLCPKQTIALIPNIVDTQNTVAPLQTQWVLHILLFQIPSQRKAYSGWICSVWHYMGCFNNLAVQPELGDDALHGEAWQRLAWSWTRRQPGTMLVEVV